MPIRPLPVAPTPGPGTAALPRGRAGAGGPGVSTTGAGRAVAADGRSVAEADDPAPRLRAAVGTRPALAPAPPAGPSAAPASGAISYGAAAYLAADALRARPRDEAVEVSVRRTGDGGRLTVARRTAGAETVAIEAQIA